MAVAVASVSVGKNISKEAVQTVAMVATVAVFTCRLTPPSIPWWIFDFNHATGQSQDVRVRDVSAPVEAVMIY